MKQFKVIYDFVNEEEGIFIKAGTILTIDRVDSRNSVSCLEANCYINFQLFQFITEPYSARAKPVKQEVNEFLIEFDEFWAIYPRHVGKEPARKKWEKLQVHEELFLKMKEHLLKAYQFTEKQYIPHASTYLNQVRWTDELDPGVDQSSKYDTIHHNPPGVIE